MKQKPNCDASDHGLLGGLGKTRMEISWVHLSSEGDTIHVN
jgi:hypothetical protein